MFRIEKFHSQKQELRQLLRSARSGRLQLQLKVLPLKHFGDRLEHAASRLAISIVTAALIVGSTFVMAVEREPALPGLRSFGLLGFIAAVIGGIWVLFSIWRGGVRVRDGITRSRNRHSNPSRAPIARVTVLLRRF